MLMRSKILTLVALAGLAAPLTGMAQAYLSPEDVLNQNGDFLVPSHQRGARWAADLETQQSIERHPAIVHDPSDPVQDNGLPPPTMLENPTIEQEPLVPVPVNQYGSLDPLTARLLARLAQQNSILASQQYQAGQPLAQTGPAGVLSVIVVILATVVTLFRARLLEKFVREA